MRIIIEEIEGAVYQDIILTEEEIKDVLSGIMSEGVTLLRSKRHYIGVRMGEEWRYPIPMKTEKEKNLCH